VQELSGIAKNRQRSLAALGALTFGHVAKLPSMLLKQKFGIWGQQLWLFSNGQWNEPLVLEIKDRTTISSSTTLPQDEHDYEAALTFMLSESTRLTGQLRREQMQAREMIIVNGNREFAARFVIVERTVIEERSANIIFVECGEPTLGFFEGERGSKRVQSERGTQLRWLPVAIFENRANLRKLAWWKGAHWPRWRTMKVRLGFATQLSRVCNRNEIVG
jgi:nucleotidyltransferase/DNA polymerase involved in DNA repair